MKRILIFMIVITQISAITVTDPTSYGYYMQQLKSFNNSVKNGLDQLESLNKLNELANVANEAINKTGKLIYNPTSKIQGIIMNLNNSINRFKNIGERVKNIGIEHFLKNYHDSKKPLKDKEWEQWKVKFESLFDNSKDEKYQELSKKVNEALQSENYDDYQRASKALREYLKLKRAEKDKLRKEALLAPATYYHDYFLNEEAIKERAEKKSHIETLIKQIDSAADLNQQVQTTNQILIEVLDVLMQQYEMQMKFYYASNIMNLQNENNIKDMEKIKSAREKFNEFTNSESLSNTQAKDKLKDKINDLVDIGKDGSIQRNIELRNY